MSRFVRIHYPASENALLLVQTHRARTASGEPHSLINEALLQPGDTVSATVEPGGAIVITEAPTHG